ncbi:MAG: hypothetical protein M3494_13135 [Actinomycetota bacterium]|nr:hypothetical protein [Actinomycetota bacterium]
MEYARARFGPTRKAFESLDETGREALARDPEELLDQWNILGDRTMVVPGDYLEVVAVRL